MSCFVHLPLVRFYLTSEKFPLGLFISMLQMRLCIVKPRFQPLSLANLEKITL